MKTKSKAKKKKKKSTSIDTKKFFKITLGVILLIVIVFVILDSVNNKYKFLKPEYTVNEKAVIDNIELTLKDIKYINKETGIELSFEITNKQANTITIKADDYFKFYDVNKVQIPNKNENDKNIIKKNDTLVYKLQYDTTKKGLYEIYFYSQIAENNIKFKFKSKDIKLDNVTEGGSVKEEEKTIDKE